MFRTMATAVSATAISVFPVANVKVILSSSRRVSTPCLCNVRPQMWQGRGRRIRKRFMPSLAQKFLGQLDLSISTMKLVDEDGDLERASKPRTLVQCSGHTVGNPEPVLAEMKDEQLETATVTPSVSNSSTLTDNATQGKEGGAAGKKTPAVVKDLPMDVSRLDIRVGLITDVKKHPDADSLYVEQIDVGESAPRTVVSGLVKFIPLEKMQNRKVCVLCNLKPTALRGIKSEAMVLAASNADHTEVELVTPPEDAQVGERVTFPGFPGEPDDILKPKKKVWETVQVDLHTGSDLVAQYKDVPFTTSSGICRVDSIANGGIK